MKQKQINKVIELWKEAKQQAIGYDVNGKENGIQLSLAKECFIEKLKKLKFNCIGEGTYKLVFSKRSVDFVVKVYSNGSVDDKLLNEEDFSPYIIESLYSDGAIKIQAKASRARKNKAYKFFENMFGKEYCEIYDIHAENVGWINGKPVIFDFVACSI